MTTNEFQEKYHDYMTSSAEDALADCIKVNEQMTGGNKVVPVQFGDRWCLMIDTAAEVMGVYKMSNPMSSQPEV